MALRRCPRCGRFSVAKVWVNAQYIAEDPDDEMIEIYRSEFEVGNPFPECQECYWNQNGVTGWLDFEKGLEVIETTQIIAPSWEVPHRV